MQKFLKSHSLITADVAAKIGVTQKTISSWKTNAPIAKLIEISRAYRIPIGEIVAFFELARDELDAKNNRKPKLRGNTNRQTD